MQKIYKYPRTYHLEGSGIQRGDEDLEVVPMTSLVQRYAVVEEKMDGANCAVSFDEDGRLLLQSRGHYLTGGPRERQFHLFKTWANRYMSELYDVLGERYIMYGEWLYAKHTVFYNALTHYFMEFDIYDKEAAVFLSTKRRRQVLAALPFVTSVLVLYEGQMTTTQQLLSLLGPSRFIDEQQVARLRALCHEKGLDIDIVLKETYTGNMMEGLYVKIEEQDVVQERYKYVRRGFLQAIVDAETHWLDRPLLPNCLKDGISLF